ncbi:hypothetical protein Tco_1238295 [Tanacetum coccineum]
MDKHVSRSAARHTESYKGPNDTFTALIKSLAEILATSEGKAMLRPPPRMFAPTNKRDQTKYCEFHEDHGHDTNDYIDLQKEIEACVRKGRMAHLAKGAKIKWSRKTNTGSRSKNKIQMIRNADIKAEKSRVSFPSITFSQDNPNPKNYSGDDPLIITADVGTTHIHKIYMDRKSSAEIMIDHLADHHIRLSWSRQLDNSGRLYDHKSPFALQCHLRTFRIDETRRGRLYFAFLNEIPNQRRHCHLRRRTREGSFSQISRVSTNPNSGCDENLNVLARVEGNRGVSYVTQRRKAGIKTIHVLEFVFEQQVVGDGSKTTRVLGYPSASFSFGTKANQTAYVADQDATVSNVVTHHDIISKLFGVLLKTYKDFEDFTRNIELGTSKVWLELSEEKCQEVTDIFCTKFKAFKAKNYYASNPSKFTPSDPILHKEYMKYLISQSNDKELKRESERMNTF